MSLESELITKVAAVEQDIELLKASVRNHGKQISSIQADVSFDEEEIQELKRWVERIRASADINHNNIDELLRRVNELQTDLTAANENIDTLSKHVGILEAKATAAIDRYTDAMEGIVDDLGRAPSHRDYALVKSIMFEVESRLSQVKKLLEEKEHDQHQPETRPSAKTQAE